MSDLRDMLERVLGATPPPQGALEQTMGRIRRRQRRRTIATGATALLLNAAAIGFLWTEFLGNRTSLDAAATPSAVTGPVKLFVVANVTVGDFASGMTTGDGSVWVSVESHSRGDNVVARIDPATNKVIGTVPVHGLLFELAIEAGLLWIGLPESVQRVDPESGQVIPKIAGPGESVTHTPGAIWAVDSANSIARIDPTTNQVVATVTLDLPARGFIISGPVGTPDAVWVRAELRAAR
jgi:DNA-binding beta-propeller fold protein YncE